MGKQKKMNQQALDGLASVFKVLGEGARLALLQELKEGEKMVGELVKATGMAQASVSKHLKSLNDVGLIERRKDGVRVYYGVSDRLVFDLCELVCGKLNRDRASMSEVEYFI